MKRITPVALTGVVAAIALAVAGCGGGSNGSSATAASKAAAPGSGATAIATRTTSLGTFLVDGQGRTLYLFEADKPNVSNCAGACLTLWPAFTSNGKPPVAKGSALASKLGTAKLSGGGSIVTYAGHPLYTYAGDQKPGATSGEGLDQFGAKWYVVKPSGDKIDED